MPELLELADVDRLDVAAGGCRSDRQGAIFENGGLAFDACQRHFFRSVRVFESHRLRQGDHEFGFRRTAGFPSGDSGFAAPAAAGVAAGTAVGLRSYFTVKRWRPVTFRCKTIVQATQPSTAFSSRGLLLDSDRLSFRLELHFVGHRFGNGDAERVDPRVLDVEFDLGHDGGRFLLDTHQRADSGRQSSWLADRLDRDCHGAVVIRPRSGAVRIWRSGDIARWLRMRAGQLSFVAGQLDAFGSKSLDESVFAKDICRLDQRQVDPRRVLQVAMRS